MVFRRIQRLETLISKLLDTLPIKITANSENATRLILYDYISNKISWLHYTIYCICAVWKH